MPYQKFPGLRRFFLDVRAQTKRGDVIAVYAPLSSGPQWSGAYDYFYGRAPYPLAGRLVLPVIDLQNKPIVANIERADYVACYRSSPPFPNYVVAWRSNDGVLLKRVKR